MTHALLLLALLAAAPTDVELPAPDASCARVKRVPFPAGDRPGESQMAALKGCDAEDLYYGITGPADPVKARLCAYAQIGPKNEDLAFGGKVILMMIYATGVGAKRDPDLAIRLACEIFSAPAELEGRVEHLERLKLQREGKVSFDLCDDITSGFMMGRCEAHAQRFAKAKRDRLWTARLAGWSASDQESWKRLRAAADAFFRARVAGEVDLSGTARAALQIAEEEHLEDGLVALVEKLEAAKLPAATPDDLQVADKALNAAYGDIMKADPQDQLGTVTKDDIKKAERAWINYRDEWVRFARAKYPAVRPETIKTWLTRERTDQLTGKDQQDESK
jgi:uncharacterized protein YecT (DUF1311 family)